jgi:hypothetical protein
VGGKIEEPSLPPKKPVQFDFDSIEDAAGSHPKPQS